MSFRNLCEKGKDKVVGIFAKNERKTIQQKAEKEFNKGNIVLPTGLRDYENYEDFKIKTSHLNNIKKSLIVIEKNGK